MTRASPPTTPDDLFRQWKLHLDGGALTTATQIAADHPEFAPALQQRINEYFAESAAALEETLTAAPGEPGTEEAPPNLPDFTVLGRLGRGGMGEVYRVRDALDREFAMKLIRKRHLSEVGRERFLDEAKAMARLVHPNIVPIHHYGFLGDQPYFLMPVYPASLRDRLEEYKADPAKAIALMAAVAEGVGYLHSQGFIHRDLKPQNILIDANGTPAVSDFGLVKNVADSTIEAALPASGGSGETKPTGARQSKTAAGAVMGTRAYMSPEQAAGLTQLASPRWDVWSLGVILHELLTGKWPECSSNPSSLLDPSTPDLPSPSTIRPGLSPKLERVISECLARDEKDRPADGSAVATALRARLPRRRGRVLTIGLTAVLAVAAIVGFLVLSHHSDPTTPTTDPSTFVLDHLADEGGLNLLRDDGKPIHQSIVLGAEITSTRPWISDTAYTIDTQRKALVEVVPQRSGDKGLRLTAKLRMNDGNISAGRVGLYCGHTRVQTSEGPAHFIAEISYCEHMANRLPPNRRPKDGGRTGEFALSGRLTGNQPESARPLDLSKIMLPTRTFESPRPILGSDEQFRELILEVTPHRVRAKCDGEDVATVSLGKLGQEVAGLAPVAGLQLIDSLILNPNGGIGIIVYQASVSVRSLRVEQID